jgi:PRC-barrel domain
MGPSLWNASHVRDYELYATDGLVGTVKDFLFDETSWTVRWVVVDAGNLLTGRKVLLPPDLLGKIQAPVRRPEARVSRQYEHGLND